MLMNPALRALLSALGEEGRRHDAHEQEHRRKLLNLEPQTATLLGILVRSSRRKRILEIGTSSGYSTLWLAWAVGAGGRVTSIERDAHKQALADANLRHAGLRDRVELLHGDATEIVAALPGPFDCVFFDADRRQYPEQLRLLMPALAADVLLLADNALSHPGEIAGYLTAVEDVPEFGHVIVPIGKGLSVAYRGPEPRTRDDERRDE